MTAHSTYRTSYLGYLNKLVGRHKNTEHRSIGTKPVDADYSALTEKTGDRIRITKLP